MRCLKEDENSPSKNHRMRVYIGSPETKANLWDTEMTAPIEFDFDDVIGRLRGLIISLGGILTSEESAEVEHFIEHGEFGEALRALAWLIVEENKRVSAETILVIRDLAKQMGIEKELPGNLISQ